jgi:hypothetical protein
VVLGK